MYRFICHAYNEGRKQRTRMIRINVIIERRINITQKEKRKRVTDIITPDDIKGWADGDTIAISAGTGAGKSYFIKNVLYEVAMHENSKILMLVHRSNCVAQFGKEITRDKKSDVIDIMTYQKLEYESLNDNAIDLSQYKYIVSDEFHYFIADAGFNNTTDVSFNQIISQANAIKIFMSATGEDVKDYIKNICGIETINFKLKLDYSFIKKLSFFHEDETMEVFIRKAISNNQKAIFFIQSVEKAYNLYRKFKQHSLFNCSKNNGKYYKYVDAEKIDNMLEEEHFDELILITTSCLDAGVNIIDQNLCHIVIDIKDIGSLIQCMGRKRIQHKDDKIYVYIKAINNQKLGSIETGLRKKLKMANYLSDNGTKAFLKKYPRKIDEANIIYDECSSNSDSELCIKKVNELMRFKKSRDIELIQSMKKLGKLGYCKYLAKKFGFYDAKKGYLYKITNENNDLESYLTNNVDKVMLTKNDRKDLIDRIDLKSNGKQLKGKATLNSALAERELPYEIIQYSTSRVVNGKKKNYKSVWEIKRISNEQ